VRGREHADSVISMARHNDYVVDEVISR